MRQLLTYARKVYGLDGLLARVCDARRKPVTASPLVVAAVLYMGLLRIRSFNALEPKLAERPFLKLLRVSSERTALCSVDTLSRALCVTELETVRAVAVALVQKAERNKVFREGWHGALRYVALDGWEAFHSRRRHCRECLVRHVRVKAPDGTPINVVKEYYHRYAVALLIDKHFDLALDIEPLLPKDLRRLAPRSGKGQPPRLVKADLDDGELTAATRLIKRVKQTYPWIDVMVGDALYANGPFLTTLHRLGLGGVIIAKKESDEPLREALHLWADEPPHQVVEDTDAREHRELWDCPDLETLSTYKGKIRCVRGRVTHLDQPNTPPSTWCMLVVGRAQRLAAHKVLAVARARWHIENTAFHQWTTRWQFDHVFVHHPDALRALFWLFFAAFDLLTFFLYLQLRCYGRMRGKCVTRTISRLVDEMLDDLARFDCHPATWDTS